MGEDENKKRERRHQEDLERLRGFRPIDDTFMRGLFKENIPLAELVLRIITGKPDLVLLKCETQADMKRVTGARSVCLDAYATDSTGKKYDIEVQRSDNGADPHRARVDLATIIKIIAGSHLGKSAYETDNRITYTGTGIYRP